MSENSPSVLDAIQVERREATATYHANVSTDWNTPIFPSGGVTSALGLRAMAAELDRPHQPVRTFSTMFVSTVPPGEIDIHVESLREGKRMAQLRADVRKGGGDEPGHLVTAAFGESREGFDFQYSTAPEVGPPTDYPGYPVAPDGVPAFKAPFFDNVEVRRVRAFTSFETGWEGGRAEAIRWIRYRNAPRLADGRIDNLSLIALADTMPQAIGQYLGPGHPLFHAPSVDLSMRFFTETEEDWVIARSMIHWAGDGYASAEITLWDANRRALAHAAQLMLLRFPAPGEFDGTKR